MDIGFLLNWHYKSQFPFLKRRDEEKGHLWFVGESYSSLDWNCTEEKPTIEELERIQLLWEKEVELNKHIDQRVYPSIPDQLDMQYWDLMNGTTIWRDTISLLKSRDSSCGEDH